MRTVAAALLVLPGAVLAGNFSSFDDTRQVLIEDPLRVEFVDGTVTPSSLRKAIASGAAARGWELVRESEGLAELSTNVRGQHMARIEVRYDPTGYDLVFRESHNLLYEEKRGEGYVLRGIHQNYNKWIRELSAAISFAADKPSRIAAARTRTSMLSSTNFAPVEDIAAVPYVKEKGRNGYKWYLTRRVPSAFAIGPNGAYAWATGGVEPVQRALHNCNLRANGQCRIYAVDKTVVWSRE